MTHIIYLSFLAKKNLNASIIDLLSIPPPPSQGEIVVVSHIQRIGYQPEKTALHGGQSRSWPAKQGKENKKRKPGGEPPLPPRCSY